MEMNLSKLQEIVKDREAWCDVVHWGRKELDKTEWTTVIAYKIFLKKFFLSGWPTDTYPGKTIPDFFFLNNSSYLIALQTVLGGVSVNINKVPFLLWSPTTTHLEVQSS